MKPLTKKDIIIPCFGGMVIDVNVYPEDKILSTLALAKKKVCQRFVYTSDNLDLDWDISNCKNNLTPNSHLEIRGLCENCKILDECFHPDISRGQIGQDAKGKSGTLKPKNRSPDKTASQVPDDSQASRNPKVSGLPARLNFIQKLKLLEEKGYRFSAGYLGFGEVFVMRCPDGLFLDFHWLDESKSHNFQYIKPTELIKIVNEVIDFEVKEGNLKLKTQNL